MPYRNLSAGGNDELLRAMMQRQQVGRQRPQGQGMMQGQMGQGQRQMGQGPRQEQLELQKARLKAEQAQLKYQEELLAWQQRQAQRAKLSQLLGARRPGYGMQRQGLSQMRGGR